jgi:putative stress-induced transcription regulator
MVSKNLSVKDGNIIGMELPADIGDLALAFANTLVHDGRGGVDDLLSSPSAARAWLAGRGLGPDADYESLLAARSATRALFAAAVAPHPASRADDGRTAMPTATALPLLQGSVDAIAPATRYAYDAGRVTVTRTTAACATSARTAGRSGASRPARTAPASPATPNAIRPRRRAKPGRS